jgi:hypothetical protein
VLDVVAGAGGQVVECDDGIATLKQRLADVAADEPGPASYEITHEEQDR